MRIPSLVQQMGAISMIGVVVFRGAKLVGGSQLYNGIHSLYQSTTNAGIKTFVEGCANKTYFFEALDTFDMMEKYPTRVLLIKGLAALFWSTVALEICHYLCGKPSGAYNAFLFPTRFTLSENSFLHDLKEFVADPKEYAYTNGWMQRPNN